MSDPDSGALQGLRIRSTAPEMSFESPVDIVNGTVQQQRSSPNASPAISGVSRLPAPQLTPMPPQLDIRLIVDNYATHKHHKVRAWLARHPRWHIHITPTFTFWLNQLETLPRPHHSMRHPPRLLTSSRKSLFHPPHNANSHPFVWTASADSALQKLARLCQRISHTEP